MSTERIEQLSGYIAAKILKQPNRRISASESLISSGLIDSFSLVDLALYVEDEFGVHLDDAELNANTFDSLTALDELISARQ